jgi:hypothetical protein
VGEICLTRFLKQDLDLDLDLGRMSSSDLEKLSAAMQEPFPELTRLELSSYGKVLLPDSFLSGSAPRLRILSLFSIPFPGLPKLLLSAIHLVNLTLWRIPHSGYISPKVMGTALSTFTSLEDLWLDFRSSDPLYLALTEQPDVCHPRHALSSPFSHRFASKGTANTWTISWPTSVPLDSAA